MGEQQTEKAAKGIDPGGQKYRGKGEEDAPRTVTGSFVFLVLSVGRMFG